MNNMYFLPVHLYQSIYGMYAYHSNAHQSMVGISANHMVVKEWVLIGY